MVVRSSAPLPVEMALVFEQLHAAGDIGATSMPHVAIGVVVVRVVAHGRKKVWLTRTVGVDGVTSQRDVVDGVVSVVGRLMGTVR
jgi:hypothetical protein